jgi:hypothetical protein
MKPANIATSYEVWTRWPPPIGALAADSRPETKTTHVGAFNTFEAAVAAAHETGISPIGYIDAAHDIGDVSYAGCFIVTAKHDAVRGCRIFDRR